MAKMVFVYHLDHLPHPEKEHLASRVRGLGSIIEYATIDAGHALIVAVGIAEESRLDLNDEIVNYLNDRHVAVLGFAKGVA